MLCDICKVNEATISYTEIMNGVTKEKHICSACAAKFAGLGDQQISVQAGGFLAGLLAHLLNDYDGKISDGDMKKSNFICPSCSTTYNEFVQYGKVGCHDCYRTFGFALDDVLKETHGSAQHTGMMPKHLDVFVDIPELKILKDEQLKPKSTLSDLSSLSIADLETMLREAVAVEEYEKAASLRDMIKEKRALIKAVNHE